MANFSPNKMAAQMKNENQSFAANSISIASWLRLEKLTAEVDGSSGFFCNTSRLVIVNEGLPCDPHSQKPEKQGNVAVLLLSFWEVGSGG